MEVVQEMEDVESLLSIVDPHNNKQMTYSETVQLLSSVTYFCISILLANGANE